MTADCAYSRLAGTVLAALIFLATLSGCSLPKIIILNDPLTAAEHDNLGRIYESQGKFDLAVQQYRAALKQNPKSVPSLLLLGDLSFKIKNYPEAGASYEKAITLQPENGDLYNNLCWVYLEQNIKLEKAGELIEKAISATPAHRAYYLDTKGVVLLRRGDASDAIAVLNEAIGLLPKDNAPYLVEAYTHLAEAYRASKDPQSALKAEQAAEQYRVRK
jgi:tetratricopeptide (TPR) repeat protein